MTVAEMTSSADGTAIAFDRTGEGPPLIVVGGAINDRRTPAALAELLAESFTVYSYDRRGRGDSSDTPPYAVEREIEDVEAVIAARRAAPPPCTATPPARSSRWRPLREGSP